MHVIRIVPRHRVKSAQLGVQPTRGMLDAIMSEGEHPSDLFCHWVWPSFSSSQMHVHCVAASRDDRPTLCQVSGLRIVYESWYCSITSCFSSGGIPEVSKTVFLAKIHTQMKCENRTKMWSWRCSERTDSSQSMHMKEKLLPYLKFMIWRSKMGVSSRLRVST